MHEVLSELLLLRNPAAQSMHAVELNEPEYVPDAHATHRVDAATALILPGVQAVHKPAFSRLMVPASHSEHNDEPATL
jgi:hypothetical protein